MLFKKTPKCLKNGHPCGCEKCVAEVLHLKSLQAIEENRKITVAAKNSLTLLQRANEILQTGEFRLPAPKKIA